MEEFLKAKEGPEADLWAMLVEEVYKPIGIHHAPTNRTIEPNDGPEQAIMAFGYYPTLGDLAKIAQLYHNRGKHRGEQILHAQKIEEPIYGAQERGLPTGGRNRYGEGRYHMAFWHDRYDSAGGCQLFLPDDARLGWEFRRAHAR